MPPCRHTLHTITISLRLGTPTSVCDNNAMSPSLLAFITTSLQAGGLFSGSGPLYDFLYENEWVLVMLVFGVLGIGGLASVFGLIYIWIRALKQPSLIQGMASCGACKYSVRGAANMTCPECGSDFRQVGIYTPNMRKPFIGPLLFLSIWSLCLWIPGSVVSTVIVGMGPHDAVPYAYVELEPPDLEAASYDSIGFSRSPYGMFIYTQLPDYLATPSDFVDVDINGPKGDVWYEVNILNNTFEDLNASVSNPKPFTRHAIESWVVSIGGDVSKPAVRQQVDQIYNNIVQTRSSSLAGANWNTFTTLSKSNSYEFKPALWFVVFQPFVWLFIYIAGVSVYFFLKKRYDKTMRRLREQALTRNTPEITPPQAEA